MRGKNKTNYYDKLSLMIDSSYEAAVLLKDTLDNFDITKIHEYISKMHEIENQADEQLHDFVNKLSEEFITPIDRNDLFDLAFCIDDVTDLIDDILLNIYMYNIVEIMPQSIQFADAFINSCGALKVAFAELPNFTKSKTFHKQLVVVNDIESEMDTLYVESVRNLIISKDISPVHQFSWIKLFERLEKCCDACETVSHILGGVVMRNA